MQPSFVASACDASCPFPLNNLPYGVFSQKDTSRSVCVAIGDRVLDLAKLASRLPEIFPGPLVTAKTAGTIFSEATLNAFLALGKPAWLEVRVALQDALSAAPKRQSGLKEAGKDMQAELMPLQSDVTMHLPAKIGDYTDFYSSLNHARNVGTMFRGPENALPPNWLHMPIGYHGRASSVVVSGTPVTRPCGQLRPNPEAPPVFAPCRLLDFELEMATLIGGPENELGKRIPMNEAGDRIFGFSLMNDWSARDIQKWEYVPLGPFGAKSFATTISPWIIPLEALEPFKQEPQAQDPEVLPYLRGESSMRGHCTYNIDLTVKLQSVARELPSTVCRSNFKNLYWTVAQQITHHTVTGCNMQPGDLIASGTISGEDGKHQTSSSKIPPYVSLWRSYLLLLTIS